MLYTLKNKYTGLILDIDVVSNNDVPSAKSKIVFTPP